jgi:hypothetical protein
MNTGTSDNFRKLKKRMINNFYIGRDAIIADAFGNEYNESSAVLPIKDNLFLHNPIRDNQNNTSIMKMAEIKYTNYQIKSNRNRIEILLPYFTAWNVNAIKLYANLLSGKNDKEVTVFLNGYQSDYEETIEFLDGIFEIRCNIKKQTNTYPKSIVLQLRDLNIQTILLTYGGKLSPKHCWNNLTLEQALNLWKSLDERIPHKYEVWIGNRKMTNLHFLISNLNQNERINLFIKGEGSNNEWRIQEWKNFASFERKIEQIEARGDMNRYGIRWKHKMVSVEKITGKYMKVGMGLGD